jgi:broad specificity phosphatase PhoE
MKTTLIVVRHGQSEGNVAQRFIGQGETALSATGREQARRTAQFLKDYPITKIYASDLSRAFDTAKPTAEMHRLEIEKTVALREIFAGDWEGELFAELNDKFPESYGVWRRDVGNAHPENGESVAALFERVNGFVAKTVAAHRGECVALFTHATPVRMMAAEWYGYSLEGASRVPFCPNASVSIVEYEDDGSHHIVYYGYDEHQGELSSRLPKSIV